MNTIFYTVNNYSTLPISLEKAKAFLRITNETDDELVASLIKSAINYAENKFNIVIGKKDYEITYHPHSQEFHISKPNLTNINFVKKNNALINYTQSGSIITFGEDILNSQITINFTCENNHFGEALEIAILRHAFFLYENRSNLNVNFHNIEAIYSHLFQNNYKI